MRFSSTFVLILVLTHFCYSQEKNNVAKSKTSETIENRLYKLDSLITDALDKKEFDQFIDYTDQYVEVALANKKYSEAAQKAMSLSYPVSVFPSKQPLVIEIIDKVIAHMDQIEDSYYRGGLYLKRGGANYLISLEDAIKDYSQAIENYQTKDTVFIADAYLYRAQSFNNIGKYAEAGKDYKEAYALYEQVGDIEYMIHARNGEIILYSENGLLDQAIEEREKLIQFMLENNQLASLASFYYNNSLDYNKKNDQIRREESLKKAIEYTANAEYQAHIYVVAHAALSEIYINQGAVEKSRHEMEIARSYVNQNPENEFLRMNFLGPFIRILIFEKNWEEAEKSALERLEITKKLSYKNETLKTHQYLSEIYEQVGEFEKSLYHHKLYVQLKDSIFDEEKVKSVLYYQTLYDSERKEKELIEKTGSIALLKEKNSNLTKQYILGGSLLTLAFILLFLYKNQQNLKAKKNMQEKFTQDLLKAQEEERKRMSKDLHDGLGQSLLLIKNKVVLSKDDSTKSLIENAIEEVRGISRALHPYQLQELGITQAIKNTLHQVEETSNIFFTSEIENIDKILSSEKEIHVFRIVQETLNNILKHSQATAVQVLIDKQKSTIRISLKDNGVGFDFSEKFNDFKSLGLKTLKERTRYLNGIMKVNSEFGKGTTIEYIIPYPHA